MTPLDYEPNTGTGQPAPARKRWRWLVVGFVAGLFGGGWILRTFIMFFLRVASHLPDLDRQNKEANLSYVPCCFVPLFPVVGLLVANLAFSVVTSIERYWIYVPVEAKRGG